MVISRKFRYALRSFVELGAIYTKYKQPVRLSVISKSQGISFQFLENIFHSFVKAGLLISIKGRSGGFLPAKPLKKISVLDLTMTINDPFYSIETHKIHDRCTPGKDCTIAQFWRLVATDVKKILSGISIEDLSGSCLRQRVRQLDKKFYSDSSRN